MKATLSSVIERSGGPVAYGPIRRAMGLVVEAELPAAEIGDEVVMGSGLRGEIVGFRDDRWLIMPFGDLAGISAGMRCSVAARQQQIGFSTGWLGRVIDPWGQPLDGRPLPPPETFVPLHAVGPRPQERRSVDESLATGVRIIDSLLTCGVGQRVGLFAGAGVGKTMLVRQIAKQTEADVRILALIGERGVEVQDMMRTFSLDDGIIVVATSDRSPLERARGALSATALAEGFARRGAKVLLMIDSLTRYAMALREIGLAIGEAPATKGYPPSVFAALPRLLERVAPLSDGGSISAFYTVLVEGDDDLADPVSDSARSLLDGHIVLRRALAMRGHFPAIDPLASTSRVVRQVSTSEDLELADQARDVLAARQQAEELRSFGAYQMGADARLDRGLRLSPALDRFLKQRTDECDAPEIARRKLREILAEGART